ncbi:MAG: 2-phospho-L-lactate guanylyltransferase [Gammaproteobacteria bacterium]
MWVILPIKKLSGAKRRLSAQLNPQQRIELSRLMFADILGVLEAEQTVQGITVISSERSLMQLVGHEKTAFMLLHQDNGYAEDSMTALNALSDKESSEILILPADIPQLDATDLQQLKRLHRGGLTLCPAAADGGTNAVLFTRPLPLPLWFGPDSFDRYCTAATKEDVRLNIARLPNIQHDIDREADLHWLSQQPAGKQSWSYIRTLMA